MRFLFSLLLAIPLALGAQPQDYSLSANIPLAGARETAVQYSLIGEYQKALQYWEDHNRQEMRALEDKEANHFAEQLPTNARQYISERANSERVIIINEMPFVSRHRAFTASLLKDLYEKGFRYFLAEAVGYDDSLAIRKYPLAHSGSELLHEPLYADLVRTALEIGYEVVPYRCRKEGATPSEKALEEVRVIHRLMRQKPDAKLLIHANFADAMEKPPVGWDGTLASRIAMMCSVNPFTIDQVSMAEKASTDLDNPYYKQFNGLESSVFVSPEANGEPFLEPTKKGVFDIQVFHPRTQYFYRRPTWMDLGGERAQMVIEQKGIKEYPCLVQVFLENEVGHGVLPLDQVELTEPAKFDPKTKKQTNPVSIYVPRKPIVIVYRNLRGEVVKEDKTRVY